MKSIYRSSEYKNKFYSLYDQFTKLLPHPVTDGFISTSFGKTHFLSLGSGDLPVLFNFHGGNTINPHALLPIADLAEKFHIISPDIIGHPGKSGETRIDGNSLDYGKWALEVIRYFSSDKVDCMGASFGGGVLAHLAAVSPETIKKAVFIIPTGFVKSSTIDNLRIFGLSLLKYMIHKTEKNLLQILKPLILDVSLITEMEKQLFKAIFDGLRLASGMPRPVTKKELEKFTSPCMIVAADKDIMCPADKVLKAATERIRNIGKTLLLANRPHMVTSYVDDMRILMTSIEEFLFT